MKSPKQHSMMLYVASFSEMWERFSFYIVEALLVVYLIDTKHLSQDYSYQLLGTYLSNSFILTIIGAYFGQNIIGYRATVNCGAALMSIGYALLLHQNIAFLHHGLALIVVGSVFFKPNMACFVGSLYKVKDDAHYNSAYNIYYASVMVGVILSTSVSGYILDYLGWSANFSIAASCMLFAFFVFVIGNQVYAKKTMDPMLYDLGHYRWLLTFGMVLVLWFFMHLALSFQYIARSEIVVCVVSLGIYLIYLVHESVGAARRKVSACIVLLFFAGLYWALLFQLFFSFNLMVKLVVNRHFFSVEIPSPVFMGVESLAVILLSPLLAQLWIKMEQNNRTSLDVFKKFSLAFLCCGLGLLVLIGALKWSSTPNFWWIVGSYALIGLGEAILAPTALAMIAQLNDPKHFGIMMAALYMFWGFGTKFADVLATWSVYPATLNNPDRIAPYFLNATMSYLGIAAAVVIVSWLAGRVFRLNTL